MEKESEIQDAWLQGVRTCNAALVIVLRKPIMIVQSVVRAFLAGSIQLLKEPPVKAFVTQNL